MADNAADHPADHASGESDLDEQHRKFREALDRKKSKQGESHSQGVSNQGKGEAHNDRKQREFRRKSGG